MKLLFILFFSLQLLFQATAVFLPLIFDLIGQFAGIITSGTLNALGKTNYCGVALGSKCTVRIYNEWPVDIEVICKSGDDTIGPEVISPGKQIFFAFGLKGTVGFWQTLFFCSVNPVGKPGILGFDVFNGDAPLDDNHWYIRSDGVFLENSVTSPRALYYQYPYLEPIVNKFTLWESYDNDKHPVGEKFEGSVKYKECFNVPKEFNDRAQLVRVCDNACVTLRDDDNCGGPTSAVKYMTAGEGCQDYYLGAFKGKTSSVEGCYSGTRPGTKEGGGKDETTESESGPSAVEHIASCGKRIVGYYPSWGTTEFRSSQAKYLTHAIFAFFETHEDGTVKLGSADPNNSEDKSKDTIIAKKRLDNFLKIVKRSKHLKGLFAVGGWENSNYFSGICASASKRKTFINSVIQILDEYKFSGIDLDFEYPVTGGAVEGVPADRDNYVTLMKELREKVDSHAGNGEKYLITFAGAAGQWTLDPGYDLPSLLEHADWANLMSYDYFGPWESKWGAYTGAPSPLYYGNPKGFSGKVNADWSTKYYVCKTKKPNKVVMGVPFYGRYWENVGDPIDPSDGMWRMAVPVNGKFEGGYVPWKEIKSKWGTGNGFVVTMHEKAKVPYAWNGRTKTFLGFENPASLASKVKYAEEKNVGGIMIWALDQDDDEDSMLSVVAGAQLCQNTDPASIQHKCPPIDEKRWRTPEDGTDKAGMCGKSAPLYNAYYPVCDPDDPGYSCCGPSGYCGSGKEYCECPTCADYLKNPELILKEPIKPTREVGWYFLKDPDGKRGRCGRDVPPLNGKVPICNPDDSNAHCCSNGGYCGTGDAYCKCDGCVDFQAKPNYEYAKKTWWSWSDGADKTGKCGKSAPTIDAQMATCDPDSSSSHCCSASGWCGSGPEFCDCKDCKNYRV